MTRVSAGDSWEVGLWSHVSMSPHSSYLQAQCRTQRHDCGHPQSHSPPLDSVAKMHPAWTPARLDPCISHLLGLAIRILVCIKAMSSPTWGSWSLCNQTLSPTNSCRLGPWVSTPEPAVKPIKTNTNSQSSAKPFGYKSHTHAKLLRDPILCLSLGHSCNYEETWGVESEGYWLTS